MSIFIFVNVKVATDDEKATKQPNSKLHKLNEEELERMYTLRLREYRTKHEHEELEAWEFIHERATLPPIKGNNR